MSQHWPEAAVVRLTRGREKEVDARQLDLTDKSALNIALNDIRPTHILHLAAASSPSSFGRDIESNLLINVEATKQLALYADQAGAKLVFTSTDFVFDGRASQPYCEEDSPKPINAYGWSKLLAERYVLAFGHTVVRLSLLHTPDDPHSSINRVLLNAATHDTVIKASTREVRTPMRADCAARAIIGLAKRDATGLFHLAGTEAMSAATLFNNASSPSGRGRIQAVSHHSGPTPERPHYVALKTRRLALKYPDLMPKPLFPDQPSLSVIVMVHNGSACITGTLSNLARQSNLEELSIIVACNGCTDASVNLARSAKATFSTARAYKVLDLPAIGRNATLEHVTKASPGPVLVLDQDAELTPDACISVVEKFRNGADFVALVRREPTCESAFVRGYYRTWSRLTYVRKSPATSGAYAARGWVFRRLATQDHVYADDKFIRLSVPIERRALVTDQFYATRAQTSVQQLVVDRARYNASHRAVARHMAATGGSDDAARWSLGDIRLLARHPIDSIAFLIVGIISTFANSSAAPGPR